MISKPPNASSGVRTIGPPRTLKLMLTSTGAASQLFETLKQPME
jgi:hypothetical protein